MSVNLTATLDQPIDTVTDCENWKASASNWPRSSCHLLQLAGRVLAIPISIAGSCRRCNKR
jgi:hypothetical protein